MMRAPARFGWAALLAAWLLDQLFWQRAPGLSFPLWVALALAIGLLVARSQKIHPSRPSLILVAAALVFAGFTVVRSEGFTLFINFLLCLLSLALLAATFRTGNWVFYKIGDHLLAGLRLILAAYIRPVELFSRVPQPALAEGEDRAPAPPTAPAWKNAWQPSMAVARGLLLALPVVLVLGGLLAAADPIFNKWMKDTLSIFDLGNLSEYLVRLFYILILAYLLAGVYLHSILPNLVEARPAAGSRLFAPLLGWIETVVVLAAVNLLFLVFVSIQFWYLFGGQANIGSSGFTYSEYAVRGFNELVWVAVLSLLLYLGLGALVVQKTTIHQKSLMALNTLLIVQVLVILISSFNRLRLYEEAYGFTSLRTYTHIFIIWLALLLVATILLELTRRRHAFALTGLLVLCGFGLTFGLLNVDGFIAQQNILRARSGATFNTQDGPLGRGVAALDTQYLSTLSDDAVPTLLAEFQHPDQPDKVKDELGAELACRAERMKQTANENTSWLSYNLSHATARQLLSANESLWQRYPITQKGSSQTVKLPSGVYQCH